MKIWNAFLKKWEKMFFSVQVSEKYIVAVFLSPKHGKEVGIIAGRQRLFGDILTKIKDKYKVHVLSNLVNKGYREIVLTGIHTGRYGIDLNSMNLEKLLRRLV